MIPYSNPNSGISAYQVANDSIRIKFKNGSVYAYDKISIGTRHFTNMVRLAESGRGLNTYINKNEEVKTAFG